MSGIDKTEDVMNLDLELRNLNRLKSSPDGLIDDVRIFWGPYATILLIDAPIDAYM